LKEKYQADIGCKDDCVMSLALAFTIFNNVKNFADMKAITTAIEDVTDDKQINVAEMIVIGSFEDSPDEHIIQHEVTYVGFDDMPNMIDGYEEPDGFS
jgi:hypothetical protein